MIEEAQLEIEEKEGSPTPWARYEQLKRELPQDLTEAEFERACRQIAAELGI